MDRILEAELAVEQKSDQGVEGPGGTGGGGGGGGGGVGLLYLRRGGGGPGLGPLSLPLPRLPFTTHLTLPWTGSPPSRVSQTSQVGVVASSVPAPQTTHLQNRRQVPDKSLFS